MSRPPPVVAVCAVLAALAVVALGALSPMSASGGAGVPEPAGFAVLELFTSEGCSSCPPADALLRAIEREHADAPVFALSFHVDYWNDLGWRDPFSDPAYSVRQRRYARALGSDRVYTPQLVVNGAAHVVGSRASAVRDWVDAALRGEPRARIDLSLRLAGGLLYSEHRVHGAPAGTAVTLALTRRSAVSRVTRGENAGRTLRHVDVVQQLRARGLAATTRWELPAGVRPSDLAVTALLQDPQTMRISAAARASP